MYGYKAFISYSHQDEAVARWLHRQLERYRLPKPLRQRTRSAGLGKIFRDRDDLGSANNLSATIQNALSGSEYLIVVCSRHSAKSDWVRQEIEYFSTLGRAEYILTCIIEPFDEFPNALVSELGSQPLAADFRSSGDGKHNGVLKLVAGLLQVGLDELKQRDRSQRKREIAKRTAALALTIAVSGGIALWTTQTNPCPDPSSALQPIWGESQRAAILKQFSDSPLPFAAETVERVLRLLDAYAEQWRSGVVAACSATRVHGRQSEILLDQRMMCLDSRLIDLSAASHILQTPDARTIENAITIASALPDLEGCADTEMLSESFPPPAQEKAEAVELARIALANAWTQSRAGRWEVARLELNELMETLETLDYPPLTASARYLNGLVLREFANVGMADAFQTAAIAAASARDDALAARIWIDFSMSLAESSGDLERLGEVLPMARASAARLRQNHPLQTALLNAEGALAYRQGQLTQAADFFRNAIDMGETLPPTSDIAMDRLRVNLATVLKDLARYPEAGQMARSALRESIEKFGEDHPATAEPMIVLAGIARGTGDSASEISLLQEVLRIRRQTWGNENEGVSLALRGLGWAHKEAGDLEAASDFLNQALVVENSLGNSANFHRANLHNSIGDLAVYLGEYDRAEQEFRKSIELWETYPGNPNIAIPGNNLGALHARLDELASAKSLCGQALALDEQSLGPNHPDLGYSLTCLGEVAHKSEDPQSAVALLERAVSVRENVASYELAWSEYQLGIAYRLAGDNAKSRQLTTRARQRLSERPSPDPYVNDQVLAPSD